MTETRAPGPTGGLLLGSWGKYRKDPLGFFLRSAMEYGGLVRFRFAHKPAFLVSEPAFIKHILQDGSKKYAKGISYESLRWLLGNGLLVSEGDLWKKQRRLMQPHFQHSKMKAKVDIVEQCVDDLLHRWETIRQPFDLVPEMMRLAFDVVGKTLLGTDIADEMVEVERVLADAVDWVYRRMEAPVKMPARIPTPRNRRFRECVRVLDGVVARVIDRHRREPRETLLAALMRENMDDRQLRDEVLTLLLAGHETTGDALCWALWLVSKHPSTDIEGIIRESLRLYPPAWSFTRTAVERDELGGYAIPKGAIVIISPWVNHRLPRFWKDPERFDPSRPEPEENYVYMPFGGGPHTCIGMHLSLFELRVTLTRILQRWRVIFEGEIEPIPSISLKPKGPVFARIIPAS